ncbi:hypothetical protein VSH64_24410 [Amycolatopsis rhabdoformis]|uniref:Tetratricopeptide repeat protein n=1 Tax=Amycolatopsis rhabdoformis TaxID=1448059 RepID=A0ABZ1HUH3_9PSEU|nr:hypothetical protein [Amycolatopsis rhabdoformis]WSE26025.1 hypothetical protein VSH64_24410 [Amycolatopsis rhabdoformis]
MSPDDDQQRLLEAPRRNLAHARRDESAWAGLEFVLTRDEQGRAYDSNRAERFGVLRALQYDRRPQDLTLLRFLLRQEITRYRETVPWGLASDLELAGFLVAEHGRLEDVWLHWQAKEISFDTALGYRTHHLLTAGVEATLQAVRSSSHPDRDRVLHKITDALNPDGTPHFTDAVVQEWLDAQRKRFPADPAAESLRTWANHAARVGEREMSRRFLLAWADQQPRTEHTLNTLQFHLAQLGFLTEATEIQKEAVAASGPGWAKASKLLTLIELQRTSGDFEGAWATLRECADAMPSDPFWKNAGLWRHFVKAHFLLVPLARDQAIARTLLDEGDRQMRGVKRLWMDGVLDAAIIAITHVGDSDMHDRYLAIKEAETRARDEEMKQAISGTTDENKSRDHGASTSS